MIVMSGFAIVPCDLLIVQQNNKHSAREGNGFRQTDRCTILMGLSRPWALGTDPIFQSKPPFRIAGVSVFGSSPGYGALYPALAATCQHNGQRFGS